MHMNSCSLAQQGLTAARSSCSTPAAKLQNTCVHAQAAGQVACLGLSTLDVFIAAEQAPNGAWPGADDPRVQLRNI